MKKGNTSQELIPAESDFKSDSQIGSDSNTEYETVRVYGTEYSTIIVPKGTYQNEESTS